MGELMNIEYQLEIDTLATSLTKPAVKLGVPFIPFFASIVFCMMGWMAFQMLTKSDGLTGIIISTLAWFFLYAFMYFLSKKDIFGLNIFTVNFLHFHKPRSFSFWGNTESYSL